MTKTVERIIEEVWREVNNTWPEEMQTDFFLSNWNDTHLVQYHHSLGQYIRNKYNLWDIPWTPEIRDNTDYSPFHPDQVSMTIIEEVWKKGMIKGVKP